MNGPISHDAAASLERVLKLWWKFSEISFRETGGYLLVNQAAHGVLTFLSYALDPANAQLRRGATIIPLRPKTLALLQFLAERSGRLVTKAELLDAVWPDTAVTEGILSA